MNSLMAMVGGTLTANWLGKTTPGFLHNGRWPAWWQCAPART